jgi:hypothetical protein
LRPGNPIIHRCEEAGCRRLAYAARCPQHTTAGDHELREAIADATVEVVVARERLREAEERKAVLEARAGIRRGSGGAGSPL